jgi:hypothetical protein
MREIHLLDALMGLGEYITEREWDYGEVWRQAAENVGINSIEQVIPTVRHCCAPLA